MQVPNYATVMILLLSVVDTANGLPFGSATEEVLVFFGNGCFWGRQKDYVDVERQTLRRSDEEITALVGYAGGHSERGGPVCYYSGPPARHYDRLGHAEVTQVSLVGSPEDLTQQLRAFARMYFSQFNRVSGGMERLDPQDAGLGYRNVVGLPGGMQGALFGDFADMNVNNMVLLPGEGGEEDTFNTVYVMDSNQFPFFQAEMYHQFHNGMGHRFGREYTFQLRMMHEKLGRVRRTRCPERGESISSMEDNEAAFDL
uniref:Peptide-methionine (S)-S-oxide reductase n=1 Tax=Pyramimonas obovata TaxID=1411642 RepID=A0A7S0MV44_9CHLO|mmetsp:Transcript_14196/g.30379  ORF Transcript_14196/g.30379 Transcript_14196/m.30379 type:complete len:257 (+) Transcript_14196:179-949(+)|eukprot:CAMPEP_0118924746 /NCGR_PEP_ID=MMETSP1169-20130426/2738_1 /TAXON_ID=36882 /ORGANISM="Pyramimonas obovata, Strain CCMP722" /LENGTH=256 /DNA_ID=CAMNT_0006865877 /DNA_START=156 /DNA_END=926 /DNA_ORIENTATION=+